MQKTISKKKKVELNNERVTGKEGKVDSNKKANQYKIIISD